MMEVQHYEAPSKQIILLTLYCNESIILWIKTLTIRDIINQVSFDHLVQC